ncbi:MAG: ImmA/IrrE family metallo-endopeptidase [Chloroflexi bacterium]|nr:ImmA/IrrE family metallo-endopeptidase [Chloroflexota bacterium]
MKTFRDNRGPFKERPYYELADIEAICGDELRSVGLLPLEPAPVRIDRFLEKRFGITAAFEDLPAGLLGYSRFGGKRLEAIVVSRLLAEDPSTPAERRVTTTLAHEAGHALLHGHLFAFGAPQKGLFAGAATGAKLLCRNESVPGMTAKAAYDGKWWEFQANQAIGALLLPRFLVERALQPFLAVVGTLGGVQLPDEQRRAAMTRLAETFEVNPAVVRIRLDQIYPSMKGQLTL